MKNKLCKNLLAIVLVIFSFQTIADQSQDIQKTPDNASYLNLSVTERTDVQEDLLMSSIRIERDGIDPKAIQNEINHIMVKALTIAKQPDINVSTGQYNIYQYNEEQNTSNQEPKVTQKKWCCTQELLLNSKSPAALLSIIGQLQNEGLLIQSLNYTLSNDKRDAIRNAMIESAIGKIKQQAMQVAKALGQEYSRFTTINIDTGLGIQSPISMYRSISSLGAISEAVMPSAEPSTSTVSLTVSATALLK